MSDASWPTELRRWFDDLPAGAASYPECRVKAAIWHELSRGFPPGLDDLRPTLPREVAQLITNPPPATAWVSEVHVNLLAGLAAERLFAHWDDFYEYTYEMNKRLLSGRMYRVLLKLLSPERVLKGSAMAYGQMHRGSSAKAERAEGGIRFTVSYPRGLYPRAFTHAFPTALRASLELSGARSVEAHVRSSTPEQTVYFGRWS